MADAPAQTLSRIRALLAERGLQPKKRYGQNFLHDANQMDRIIKAAIIEPGDLVLEVGAGTGALTGRLLHAGAKVVAIEIDSDLADIVQSTVDSPRDRFVLIEADAMTGKHDLNPAMFEALRDLADRDDPPFKLIANLPYNVASPLLAELTVQCPRMTMAVLLIQREVADRLLAAPGTKAYGPIGVLVQAAFEVERIATIAPSCFWPQPQVQSAVVRLSRRRTPLSDDLPALSNTLQLLFQRRRKQLGTIIGRDVATDAGLDPKIRPEQLTVEQLAHLAGSIS